MSDSKKAALITEKNNFPAIVLTSTIAEQAMMPDQMIKRSYILQKHLKMRKKMNTKQQFEDKTAFCDVLYDIIEHHGFSYIYLGLEQRRQYSYNSRALL